MTTMGAFMERLLCAGHSSRPDMRITCFNPCIPERLSPPEARVWAERCPRDVRVGGAQGQHVRRGGWPELLLVGALSVPVPPAAAAVASSRPPSPLPRPEFPIPAAGGREALTRGCPTPPRGPLPASASPPVLRHRTWTSGGGCPHFQEGSRPGGIQRPPPAPFCPDSDSGGGRGGGAGGPGRADPRPPQVRLHRGGQHHRLRRRLAAAAPAGLCARGAPRRGRRPPGGPGRAGVPGELGPRRAAPSPALELRPLTAPRPVRRPCRCASWAWAPSSRCCSTWAPGRGAGHRRRSRTSAARCWPRPPRARCCSGSTGSASPPSTRYAGRGAHGHPLRGLGWAGRAGMGTRALSAVRTRGRHD